MQFARPSLHDWLLAFVYLGAAAATLATTRFDGGVAFLWLGSAILIPALVSRPRREWGTPVLLCAVASTLATGLFGLGWQLALPFALVNMVEAYVGATMLVRMRLGRTPFASLHWLAQFVLAIGIVAPLCASLLAGTILAAFDRPSVAAFIHFFIGHALGNITFIPVLSLITSGELRSLLKGMKRHRALELVGLLSLVALTTVISFAVSGFPLLFLPCGPIILAIFRGRQIGAAMSIVILAVIGGAMTALGYGPIHLVGSSLGGKMQFFQFYLASVVLTVLPVAADLRHRSKLHRQLRLSEERYRMLADHSSDILMHADRAGRVRFVSNSIMQIGGYEPADLVGRFPGEMITPEFRDLVRAEHDLSMACPGTTRSFEYRAILRDGQQRWFETHMKAIVDRDGEVEGVLSVIRDISARKAVEAKLTAAALTDSLTGLPNRRAFWDVALAQPAPREGRMTCIAVIDVDHFKQVNDLHGHDGGDKVLVQLGVVARRVIRTTDLVARLGGEEFALLLCDTTLEDAIATCERLRHEVALMGVPARTGMIRVTISGGVAAIKDDGLEAALKRADLALYEAKAGGRDRLQLAA